MASNVIEIPEDGQVIVKFGSDQFTLDAFRVHNTLIKIRSDITDKEDSGIQDFHEAVAEYLHKDCGLPKLNHFQADSFVTAIQGAVEQLEKKLAGGKTPSSPASTEPNPSPSQAA